MNERQGYCPAAVCYVRLTAAALREIEERVERAMVSEPTVKFPPIESLSWAEAQSLLSEVASLQDELTASRELNEAAQAQRDAAMGLVGACVEALRNAAHNTFAEQAAAIAANGLATMRTALALAGGKP